MKTRFAVLSLASSLLLALSFPAVASQPDAEAEARLALLNAHAGESVERVTFLRAVDSYEVVGQQNLLIWETPSKAWLVDLRASAACRSLDRQYKISLSGGFADIKTNGYIHSPNGICRIEQIRPVNVEAMRADEGGATALAQS